MVFGPEKFMVSAWLSCVLLRLTKPNNLDRPAPENYSTYFMKIDGVKFKRKVVPGDTLQFEIHLLEPIRRGVALVEAKAFVGETLACEAVMMAQVVKNKK